jgi:dual specificity tyrosine-phosphorylation-regulated kinase 2/3/4
MPSRVESQKTATNPRARSGNNSQYQAPNAARINGCDLSGTWRFQPLPRKGGRRNSAFTDIDYAAEFSPRNRLQKKSSNPSVHAEIAPLPPSTNVRVSNNAELGPPNRKRQSSIPNQKGPMGPRPLDASAGKRYGETSVHDGAYGPDEIPVRSFSNITHPYHSATVNELGNCHERQDSINSISRFSFASIGQESSCPWQDEKKSSLDFGSKSLAAVNFDDFHNNITSTEPSFNRSGPVAIPVPANNIGRIDETSIIPRPVSNTGSVRKASGSGSVGRAGSFKQHQITAVNTASRPNPNLESMQAPVATPVLRSRRQSHFPPNSFHNGNPTPRAPRKSIDQGTSATQDSAENGPARKLPGICVRKPVAGNSVGLPVQQNNRLGEVGNTENSKFAATARNARAKSLQPPKRENAYDPLTPSWTPDYCPSSPTSASQARRKSFVRTGTPPSTNKRMSVMPHHATGLGARTISPTDARRLKRLSIVPQQPPMPASLMPQTPSTPQPDPPRRPRSTAQSPALNPRKSVTPSSSRTTPDPNRKSYSSGQSLSSNTSYNSVRNSTGPLPPLPQGSMSTSRLPTPKPRLETTNVDGTEEVPPVPAIPKAYESPQSEMEQPFFSARSSSLPHVDSPISASPTVESVAEAMAALETPRDPEPASHSSSLMPDAEARQNPVPAVGRKGLQPLRLPPINLLPLSTPTAAKIMALENLSSPNDRVQTPPSRHMNGRTPSTPMTASRVNFPSRTCHDNDPTPAVNIRSSSSHHALRGEFDAFPAAHGSINNMPFSFATSNTAPRNISPFISSSLPKNSGEFASYMQPKHSGESNRKMVHAKPPGPGIHSFSSTSRSEEKPSPNDAASSFSASAIRRKLSLTRRRSTSKNRENAENDAAAKYNSMPPPKLPASATWGNLAAASSSPIQKQPYLTSRRKTSASSFMSQLNERDQTSQADHGQRLESRPSTESNRSFNRHPNRSSPLISPAANVLSSKSGSQLRPQDVGLDRDDLVAEEEMKKLATKRKDAECAALELDALRRRAFPGDRASPLHALQAGNLNIFERGEVVDYEDIYFTGTRSAKKIVGDLDASANNFAYDDERGDYNIVNGDHLAYRYEVIDLLGKGSFGQVVRCIDHKTGILVAVKIIRNKKRFHQQALVEVNILQRLREWDPDSQHSVVNFDQSFYFRGHLCISTDLLDMNLYEFIKAHDFRGFSLKVIRRFTKQLLSSLVLLNSHKVIHCDLKPENVLLAHPMHSEIKVIDFGSGCFENEKVYTYIQSRFYRSPEVILGMSYGMPIDMWSLGCILAELYTGYPIFPGENEQEQLACIMEVFGPPEKHLIEKSSRKKLFFDSLGKPRLTVSSKGRRRRPSSKELRQALKCDDEAFLDFIAKCLRWDPSRRLNPHQAMMHEFVMGVKLNVRKSQAGGNINSPIKRVNSTTTSSATRPLPQLPSTTLKNGAPGRPTEVASNSPSKHASKRLSTMNGLQPAFTSKRASYIPPTSQGSTIPKVLHGQRSISGRPDLATAAAATASLVSSIDMTDSPTYANAMLCRDFDAEQQTVAFLPSPMSIYHGCFAGLQPLDLEFGGRIK